MTDAGVACLKGGQLASFASLELGGFDLYPARSERVGEASYNANGANNHSSNSNNNNENDDKSEKMKPRSLVRARLNFHLNLSRVEKARGKPQARAHVPLETVGLEATN